MYPPQDDAFLQQAAHSRRSVVAAIFSAHVPLRRLARGHNRHVADTPSPQIITDHPRLLLPDPNEVGVLNYATDEPAPVSAASWDGETGASAPTVSRTF